MHEIRPINSYLSEISPRDLFLECYRTGEKLSREEWVPLGDIIDEGTPIDESHALDLGRALTGEWKQTLPVLLRATEGSGQLGVSFEILDGFHRVIGLKMISAGIDTFSDTIPVSQLSEAAKIWIGTPIRSVVLYGCSEEEKYDQRILAANSVKSVRFARLAYWMKGAWRETPWSDLISVTQAFGLASSDSSGTKLGVSWNQAENIKDWVRKKASVWLMQPAAVYQQLRIVDFADPYLVIRVRTGAFIKGGLALTPPQLNKIVDAFPHNHPVQRAIAEYANKEGLSTPQIAWLVNSLGKLDRQDEQAIKSALSQMFVPRKETFFSPQPRLVKSDRVLSGDFGGIKGEELALDLDTRESLTNLRLRIISSNWTERKKRELLSAIRVLLNRL